MKLRLIGSGAFRDGFVEQENEILMEDRKYSAGARAPLSPYQKALWLHRMQDPSSPVYNIPIAYRIRGPLDGVLLEKAIQMVVNRHEILRTRIEEEEGEPVLTALERPDWNLKRINLSDLEAESIEQQAELLTTETSEKIFRKDDPCLLRGILIRLGPEHYQLVFCFDHLVIDEWGVRVFLEELSDAYCALIQGKKPSLEEPTIQFSDYTVWLRAEVPESPGEEAERWWAEYLKGIEIQEEPPAWKRARREPFRGAVETCRLSKEEWERIEALAEEMGMTLFPVIFAATFAMIHLRSGETDIVLSTPVSMRDFEETHGLIGFFVHALPVRVSLKEICTFRTLIEEVYRSSLEVFAHKDFPLHTLKRAEGVWWDSAALLDRQFVYMEKPDDALRLSGLNTEWIDLHTGTSKYSQTFYVKKDAGGARLELEYSVHTYEAEQVVQTLRLFQRLLTTLPAHADENLNRVPLLDETEWSKLMSWQGEVIPLASDRGVADEFRLQVERQPELVALYAGERKVSYGELDRLSNRVAVALQNLGLDKGDRVGILAGRGIELVVAMLATVKLGAVYVPLEPSLPESRLNEIVNDAEPFVVLKADSSEVFEQSAGRPFLSIEKLMDEGPVDAVPRHVSLSPQDPIYLMYTSGSTGKPKGCLIPHGGVIRLVKEVDYVSFNSDEVFLYLSSPSFDLTTFEVWGPLLNGLPVAIVTGTHPTIEEIRRVIVQRRVTTAWFTTGLFNLLVDQATDLFGSLSQVLVGGDVVSAARVKRLRERYPDLRLINGYGPTENTTFSACCRMHELESIGRAVPIGRCLRNSEIYLLDEQLRPVPIGIRGELYLGGDGLSLGYWKRPELNKERFIPHPFSEVPDARLYRSGDYGRWREDGQLEFFGRSDNQVKIRGFRVELDEIERRIEQTGLFRQCVVVYHEGEGRASGKLIAYVVTDPPTRANHESRSAWRSRLADELPDYMLPSHWVVLEAIPLTRQGKVDKRNLPSPDDFSGTEVEAALPETALEKELEGIWKEILEIDAVGREDDFFLLGGESLGAMRLIAKIHERIGVEIPLARVFRSSRLHAMAAEVGRLRDFSEGTFVSPIQRRER